MQRLLTALTIALFALPVAGAAAAHVTPSAGGRHADFVVAARAPIADALANHYVAGSIATTFFARVVAPHGCATPAAVNASETGTEIAAGETLHFTLAAPPSGWCRGRYHVQLRDRQTTTLSPDACVATPTCAPPAPAASRPTTLFARSAFVVR